MKQPVSYCKDAIDNAVQYVSHITPNIFYYHRQYDQDIIKKSDGSYVDTAKRVVLIAVPFISLYKPCGRVISASLGSFRVVSNITMAIKAKDIKETSYYVVQVSFSIVALAGTCLNFTVGMYLTTVVDIATNLLQMIHHLKAWEFNGFIEQSLQSISSILYLSVMISGSLEVIILSLTVQALICIYQAKEELFDKKRVLEAIAKVIFSSIRLYQANQYLQLKNNPYYQRYNLLRKRIENGRKISHLYSHPLNRLVDKIKENQTIFTDDKENDHDFGSNFFGFGRQVVKGMNLRFHEKDDNIILDFRVNHVFRERFKGAIDEIMRFSEGDNRIEKVLSMLPTGAAKITSDQGWLMPTINVEGLGSVAIGMSEDCTYLYDQIAVSMKKNKSIYDLHSLLSLFSLEDILKVSLEEDVTRMKMGHLFRIFYPQKAIHFERTGSFFDLSIEELKGKMIEKAPEMKELFDKYLQSMDLREILPGRMRYSVPNMAENLRSLGAKGLTAAVTGAWGGKQELFSRVSSILKMGMLSSATRRDNDMENVSGLSSYWDYYTGGADSVFTQLVTDENKSFDEFDYIGKVRLLFSLKATETGTYQYHSDNFGDRRVTNNLWWWGWLLEDYKSHQNIFDFIRKERFSFNSDNEVMIKERIAPEYITGIVVKNNQIAKDLLQYFRDKKIVQLTNGVETILGRTVDQFIHVGNEISDSLFS